MSDKLIQFPIERTRTYKAAFKYDAEETCPCIELDDGTISGLSPLEEKLIAAYRSLDDAGKAYIEDLADEVNRVAGPERAAILRRALEYAKAGGR